MKFSLRILSGRKTLLVTFLVTLFVKISVFVVAVPFEADLPPMYPNLEPYEDYRFLYMKDVGSLLNGSRIYVDFYHAYPPPFISTLAVLRLVPVPVWTPAVIIVLFDALTVIPVYLISQRYLGERRAIVASLLTGLAPVSLWWSEVFWLNPPPSTFFMVLSVYLLLSRKYMWASLALGIATGYKQTAFSMFPALLVPLWLESKRSLAKFIVVFLATMVAVSTPFLFTIPITYLWSIGIPGAPRPPNYAPPPSEFTYEISTPVNILTTFGIIGIPSIPLESSLILGPALLGAYGVLMWRMFVKKRFSGIEIIAYVLYSILIFHALFPRGIYKYYFTALIPFLALLIRGRGPLLFFMILNVALLLVPRNATPYFAILVLVFMPSILNRLASGVRGIQSEEAQETTFGMRGTEGDANRVGLGELGLNAFAPDFHRVYSKKSFYDT